MIIINITSIIPSIYIFLLILYLYNLNIGYIIKLNVN